MGSFVAFPIFLGPGSFGLVSDWLFCFVCYYIYVTVTEANFIIDLFSIDMSLTRLCSCNIT